MTLLLACSIAILFAIGGYLLMRRSIVRVVFGLVLLSHGANLLIFTSANLVPLRPPIARAGAPAPEPPFADPLPSALILTAIVIGFGVLSFTLVLVRRAARELRVDDVEELCSERPR
ncbi:MAG TPA: NADH-quinone oxidoreductase subunit K [Phycisphaerales bacterium]|nr:NADH-quinone oxidoreductase subunit K [Phycisphaerales bacterium]HMP36895.1 NADH-quinone oxidoreductase subunit K [Phycisphaerales bacterium]